MEVYKRQDFSSYQLSLFFLAFQKRLFTRPTKGQVFSSALCKIPNGMSLLFRFEFYENLVSEMKAAQAAGKFSNSNAQKDWDNLLNTLESADVDFGTMGEDSDYYLKCSPFWD